jgi:integrase
MKVGDWCRPRAVQSITVIGRPLSARSKDQHLAALRAFFRDGQEWGWFPRRFDPVRALATPRSVKALLGPKPRVIADDVWAKLLWAGLNLTEQDLPGLYRTRGTPYPLTMVRALVVTWLFAGLRADELRRLRVGCVRWQREDVVIPGSTDALPKEAVCWLDVPTNKTGTSFTKAVDRIVG